MFQFCGFVPISSLDHDSLVVVHIGDAWSPSAIAMKDVAVVAHVKQLHIQIIKQEYMQDVLVFSTGIIDHLTFSERIQFCLILILRAEFGIILLGMRKVPVSDFSEHLINLGSHILIGHGGKILL